MVLFDPKKVPDKFLVGLSSINFYDDEKYPIVRYVKGKPFLTPSRIDVFMCTMFCIYQVYERITIDYALNREQC